MADETTWDSWEDFADSAELDKHVDQHLRMNNGCVSDDLCETEMQFSRCTDHSSTGDTFDNTSNSTTQFRILPRPVVHEDDVNRTAYTPQVKILRRPGLESGMLPDKDKEKQKSQPARSLAEREAAYAEARKRIMGPVPSQASSTSNSKPRSSDHRKPRNTKHENSQNNPVRVERLPKGPDKSGKGFNSPR